MTEEKEQDHALRPADWDEYIGQEKLKNRLQISINSALSRGAPLGHVLLYGPPGYGKTSLAALIADEMMEDFHSYVMPVKKNDLRSIFLDKQGVLFLDEIHLLKKAAQEEVLLSALEDHKLTFPDGKTVKLHPKLTVVAATTNIRQVTATIRDRFDHQPRFEPYSEDEMAQIIKRMAAKSDPPVHITEEQALRLGRASAGVPRQARRLVRAARDLGTANPNAVLEMTGITKDGLTEDHLQYLRAMLRLGGKTGKVGIDPLSNFTGQPKDILVDLEKLLLDREMIGFSQRGRYLTVKGWQQVADE